MTGRWFVGYYANDHIRVWALAPTPTLATRTGMTEGGGHG